MTSLLCCRVLGFFRPSAEDPSGLFRGGRALHTERYTERRKQSLAVSEDRGSTKTLSPCGVASASAVNKQ